MRSLSLNETLIGPNRTSEILGFPIGLRLSTRPIARQSRSTAQCSRVLTLSSFLNPGASLMVGLLAQIPRFGRK